MKVPDNGAGRGALIRQFTDPKVRTITVGRIEFVRTRKGRSHDCQLMVRLGQPKDNYEVGQRLDIVLAAGTCQRVDVMKRLE